MNLYLMRHGEAASAVEDLRRGLTTRGRFVIEHVAERLKKSGVQPSLFWHSGKARAEQTAEITHSMLNGRGVLRECDGMTPNDLPSHWLPALENVTEDLLIVSHLPFLPRLVALLCIQNERQMFVDFQPGSVACLDSDDRQTWYIKWILSSALCS